jgi:hypothetical protein
MLLFFLCIFALLFFIFLLIRNVAGLFNPYQPASYNGPVPTKKQQVENQQMMMEYLQNFPSSPIAKEYPELLKMAEITNRYEHLNKLLEEGKIDEITYQVELEKILPDIPLKL